MLGLRETCFRRHPLLLNFADYQLRLPQYCAETLRDLPNMGERERGKPDPPVTQPAPAPLTHTASLFSPPLSRSASATHQPQVRDRRPTGAQAIAATTSSANDVINSSLTSTNKPTTTPQGWSGPLRQVLWEKWRWGVLIAFAVIVSRLSSSS